MISAPFGPRPVGGGPSRGAFVIRATPRPNSRFPGQRCRAVADSPQTIASIDPCIAVFLSDPCSIGFCAKTANRATQRLAGSPPPPPIVPSFPARSSSAAVQGAAVGETRARRRTSRLSVHRNHLSASCPAPLSRPRPASPLETVGSQKVLHEEQPDAGYMRRERGRRTGFLEMRGAHLFVGAGIARFALLVRRSNGMCRLSCSTQASRRQACQNACPALLSFPARQTPALQRVSAHRRRPTGAGQRHGAESAPSSKIAIDDVQLPWRRPSAAAPLALRLAASGAAQTEIRCPVAHCATRRRPDCLSPPVDEKSFRSFPLSFVPRNYLVEFVN